MDDRAKIKRTAVKAVRKYLNNLNFQEELLIEVLEKALPEIMGEKDLDSCILHYHWPGLAYDPVRFNPGAKAVGLDELIQKDEIPGYPGYRIPRLDQSVAEAISYHRSSCPVKLDELQQEIKIIKDLHSTPENRRKALYQSAGNRLLRRVEEFIDKLDSESPEQYQKFAEINVFPIAVQFQKSSQDQDDPSVYQVDISGVGEFKDMNLSYCLKPYSQYEVESLGKLSELLNGSVNGIHRRVVPLIGVSNEDGHPWTVLSMPVSRNLVSEFSNYALNSLSAFVQNTSFKSIALTLAMGAYYCFTQSNLLLSSLGLLAGSAYITYMWQRGPDPSREVFGKHVEALADTTALAHKELGEENEQSTGIDQIKEEISFQTKRVFGYFKEFSPCPTTFTRKYDIIPDEDSRIGDASVIDQIFSDILDKYEPVIDILTQDNRDIGPIFDRKLQNFLMDYDVLWCLDWEEPKTRNRFEDAAKSMVLPSDELYTHEHGFDLWANDKIEISYDVSGLEFGKTNRCFKRLGKRLERGRIFNFTEEKNFFDRYIQAAYFDTRQDISEDEFQKTRADKLSSYYAAAAHVSLLSIGYLQRSGKVKKNVINKQIYCAASAAYYLTELSLDLLRKKENLIKTGNQKALQSIDATLDKFEELFENVQNLASSLADYGNVAYPSCEAQRLVGKLFKDIYQPFIWQREPMREV
ncbi:hypothetical protein GF327_04940 [Candidatus Woesearchaeota archaeon]|nr:hypothetical protein [Candidatus Woesearchaeota archaeon]